jgi:hypothetical protein
MKFVGDDLFFENNPRIIESKIIEFILSLRNKGKSHGAILNYLNAIKSFYKINDIVLNVHKINKFMPEQMRVNKDRAYTHEEIGKLLEISDEELENMIDSMYSVTEKFVDRYLTISQYMKIPPAERQVLLEAKDKRRREVKKKMKNLCKNSKIYKAISNYGFSLIYPN